MARFTARYTAFSKSSASLSRNFLCVLTVGNTVGVGFRVGVGCLFNCCGLVLGLTVCVLGALDLTGAMVLGLLGLT